MLPLCLPPLLPLRRSRPWRPCRRTRNLIKLYFSSKNRKLCQKLEAQKIEIQSLEDKFELCHEKQKQYGKTLAFVSRSWEELVDDLESSSLRTRRSSCNKRTSVVDDGAPSSADAVFLSRLMETGATECSSVNEAPQHMIEDQDLCRKRCRRETFRVYSRTCGLTLFGPSWKSALNGHGKSAWILVRSPAFI